MNEISETSDRPSSTNLRNVTFSQALAAGHTHCDWLDGRRTDPSGRARALANHSVSPAREWTSRTNAICGPRFGGSSPSAGLQRSLESRLRRRLVAHGWPEYELTWKRWDMPSVPPICALRARAHRTSASDCSGWPTPVAQPANGTPENFLRRKRNAVARGHSMGISLSDLQMVAKTVAGWPTPNAMAGGATSRSGDRKGELLIGGLVRGLISTSSSVPTAANGVLAPEFSRWLMGFPPSWGRNSPGYEAWCAVQDAIAKAHCGATGTLSSRKSPPSL